MDNNELEDLCHLMWLQGHKEGRVDLADWLYKNNYIPEWLYDVIQTSEDLKKKEEQN